MRRMLGFWLFLLLCTPAFAQYWQHCTLPSPYNNSYYLDVYFLETNPQFGWVCGFNGHVVRTTNGGTTWQGATVPYAGRSGGHLESVQFTSTQVGYCSGPCGVFKSTDGGASWADVSPIIPGAQTPWGLSFINDNWGVVVSGGCTSSQYFIRTSNGGATWTTFSANVINSGLTDVTLNANGSGNAVSSGQLWSTNDSGRTWSTYQSGFQQFWNEELSIKSSSFLVPWAGSQCSGGGGGGGARFSTDSGATWNSYSTGVPMYGAFLLSPTLGWVCGNGRTIMRTTDAGGSWELKNCGIDGDLDDLWFINDSTGFAAGNGVYRYAQPERNLSKSPIDFGSFCFPGEKFDTLWVRNKSFNGVGATWALSGPDVQHFSILQPLSSSFGIAPCDSAMFVIRFQPRSAGAKSVTLSVTLPSGSQLTTSISGSSRGSTTVPVDTLIQVNPAQCGTPVRVVALWNNTSTFTDQVIQIQRISGATFSPEASPPILIPPGGGSVGFTITLADTGWQIGRYQMRIGPCIRDTIFTIKAYGVSPIINVPLERNYVSQCLAPVLDSIAVTNTGNADLIINNCYFASGSTEFSILGWSTGELLPITIKKNTTKYVYIRFAPTSSGLKTAVLRMANNDQTTARGVRTLVDVNLRASSSGLSDSISVTEIDFGRLCPGQSLTKKFKLYNTGSTEFKVLAPPALRSEFVLQSSVSLAATVAAKDSITFFVTFQAASPGIYNDSLVLAFQPCDSARVVIPIRGEIVTTLLKLSPSSIDTSMRAGTSAQFTIQIESVGSGDAIVDAISLTPARIDWRFVSQPTLPLTLKPGAISSVTIELNPTSSTTYTGVLTFNVSGICSTSVSTSIRVVVTETQISLSKNSIDFGLTRCVAQSHLDSIIVRNDGGTADSIVAASIVGVGSTSIRLLRPSQFPVTIALGQPISLVIQTDQQKEGIDSARLVLRFAQSYGGLDVEYPLRAEFRVAQSSATDSLIDFGQAEACDSPQSRYIHFTNSGTIDDQLVCNSVVDAALSLSKSVLTVKAQSSDSVMVTFNPSAQPARTIQQKLLWQSTVCSQSNTVSVLANIVEPRLTVSPRAINFGQVWKGSTSQLYFGVKNASKAPRRLRSIDIVSQNLDEIFVSYSKDTLLLPGDTLSVRVSFVATTVGDFSAELKVHEQSSCKDSTLVLCSAVVPKELYVASLHVQKAVIVDVNDTADVHVTLRTNDTSDQALFKAQPSALHIKHRYNNGVMNVLRVFARRAGFEIDLPYGIDKGSLSVTLPSTASVLLGATDTLYVIRAQGMQFIPNYTAIETDAVTADVPPGKDYVITKDDGDFSVQACVKWARITLSLPLTAHLVAQPSHDNVEVKMLSFNGSDLHIQLCSLEGQTIHNETVSLLSQNCSVRVSTEHIASGTYFLRISDESEQVVVLKVLIQH